MIKKKKKNFYASLWITMQLKLIWINRTIDFLDRYYIRSIFFYSNYFVQYLVLWQLQFCQDQQYCSSRAHFSKDHGYKRAGWKKVSWNKSFNSLWYSISGREKKSVKWTTGKSVATKKYTRRLNNQWTSNIMTVNKYKLFRHEYIVYF